MSQRLWHWVRGSLVSSSWQQAHTLHGERGKMSLSRGHSL